MDKQLLKNLINAKAKREPELDSTICPGEAVRVYKVQGENDTCIFWNSSNNGPFDTDDVCKEIADQLLEDEDLSDGRVNADFNEIMFEIR